MYQKQRENLYEVSLSPKLKEKKTETQEIAGSIHEYDSQLFFETGMASREVK